jgi:glutathione S-transferase
MTQHILYGVEISYFTGKARSYLRWKGVGFEERPSDAAFYKEICVPRIGYPMIPLLITPEDEPIQDTTLIMDHFEANKSDPSFTPVTPVQNLVSLLMELYADDWLLMPAMHYRWEYDADTTMLEFGMNLAPGEPIEVQREVGEKRAGPFRGALPFLGIHDHNKHLVEKSYLELLADLETHFQQHDFLLGDRPCIGDFGLIGALYAHLYRDATAGALMRQEALSVARYVERMMWPSGVTPGEYLSDDEIPDTLLPILQRMMREHLPPLVDTIEKLTAWKQDNPDTDIPRAIGFHDFELEDVTAPRAIRTYSAWMLGRAKNHYDGLTPDDKSAADNLLAQAGGNAFGKIDITAPVKLEDYRLQWAD